MTLKLTYFHVRGRCFPILLVLVDSGADFKYEEVTFPQWIDLKKSGAVAPPAYPFLQLPVLEYELDGGEKGTLGETGTILMFLEEHFRSEGHVKRSLHLRTQLEMVKEASAFFLNYNFQLTFNQDWLAPPSRAAIKNQVTGFVTALEHNLTTLGSDIIPAPSDQLLAAAASAFVALYLSGDLFPSLRAQMNEGGLFPSCARLIDAVEQRSRIKEWFENENIRQKAWTIMPAGQVAWIQEQAEKYD